MSNKVPNKHQHAGDRRVQRTVKSIHDAFLELAEEKSIDKISISALSERANINRKTFYLHYNSIEDLFDELLYSEMLESSKNINKNCIDENGVFNVASFFSAMSSILIESFSQHQAIYRHISPKWFIDHIEPILTDIIVNNDSLKLADSLGPYLKYCVTFYCSGLLSAYRRWLDDDSTLPMSELSRILNAGIQGSIESLAQLQPPVQAN